MTNDDRPFRRLTPPACADLLRLLASPSDVRADVIRQFHERGEQGMVEVLSELEAEDLLRMQVLLELERGEETDAT